VSLADIKTAIEQLSFEERAELAAWLHGWNDDEWDDQMKRDIAAGKLDRVLHEIEEDIKAGCMQKLIAERRFALVESCAIGATAST
jgi:hypothetical protein